MATPVKFSVTSGRADRGSAAAFQRFYPTFTVVYADGSQELGPWLLFRKRLGGPKLSSDRVKFANGGFSRNPGAGDGRVECQWTFSEGGVTLEAVSFVEVVGQPSGLSASNLVGLTLGGGTRSGPHHDPEFPSRPTLLSAEPDVVTFENSRFMLKPEAGTEGAVTCEWEYREGTFVVRTRSILAYPGGPFTLSVPRVEGKDSQGQAAVQVRVAPARMISQARLLVDDQLHNTKGEFVAGEFGLKLDQNLLLPESGADAFAEGKQPAPIRLRVEVDDVMSGTVRSSEFTGTVTHNPPAFDRDRLTVTSEKGEAVTLPVDGRAWSLSALYSVPVAGQTHVVPHEFFRDSALRVAVETTGIGERLKASRSYDGSTASWSPAGPEVPFGPPSFEIWFAVGPDNSPVQGTRELVDADPGANWWYEPGKGVATATMIVTHKNADGSLLGQPLGLKSEVQLP